MLPQHLKQIRVLMMNDKENLERSLFRLEQGSHLLLLLLFLLMFLIFLIISFSSFISSSFSLFSSPSSPSSPSPPSPRPARSTVKTYTAASHHAMKVMDRDLFFAHLLVKYYMKGVRRQVHSHAFWHHSGTSLWFQVLCRDPTLAPETCPTQTTVSEDISSSSLP